MDVVDGTPTHEPDARRVALNEPPVACARDLAGDVSSGRASVREIAERTLAALERHEPDLHGMVAFEPELVLAAADELDEERAAGRLRGPLHGVPVGVKDIIETRDLPTQHGSPIHAGRRTGRDAPVVERLRAAGALIIGKTVTTEFACFSPGPTRNPHGLDRTPGGSSSGSAALVAAGILPLALGTQTAGSIIRPAAFCGAVGVKPTRGAVPLDGILALAPSLDTVGIIARDVDGAALALAVMADAPLGDDPHAAPGGAPAAPRRIAWWPGADPSRLEPGTEERLRSAALALGGSDGVVAEEIELPGWFADLIDAQATLMRTEMIAALETELSDHLDLISPVLKAFLAPGPDIEGARRALVLRDRALEALGDVFGRFDAILTPSALGEAPDAATTGDPEMCRTWTLLGTPAVVVPGIQGPSGLPLGLQVVGPPGADARTLGVARGIEAALQDR